LRVVMRGCPARVLRKEQPVLCGRNPHMRDARVRSQLMRNSCVWAAHRQDIKGTRWMPWHQETKKDVDGCDKPR
jgi:hypothetical protein